VAGLWGSSPQNGQPIAFHGDDSTGRVAVDPVGAEIEAGKRLDRCEPAQNGEEVTPRIAGTPFRVQPTKWRTLGYRKVEE
jgi:hypothetical protein